jgi:hypothetical protein
VVRAVFAAIDEGDEAAARALLADDFVKRSRTRGPDGTEHLLTLGAQEWLAALVPLHEALSELDHGVECRDDGPGRCTGTFHAGGVHTGTLRLARRGVTLAPTGRRVVLPPEPFRAELDDDGLLAVLDVRHPADGGIAGLLRQLGG